MKIDPLNITSLQSTAEIDECLATRAPKCMPVLAHAYENATDEQVSAEVARQLATPGGAATLLDRVYTTGVCAFTEDNECDGAKYFKPAAETDPFVNRWAALPDTQRERLLAQAYQEDLLIGEMMKHPPRLLYQDLLGKFVQHDVAIVMKNHPAGDVGGYVKTHPM